MKSGQSKQKGAAFEREVCKQLSLWLSDNERTDLLWRSAMSGGRATVLAKSGEVASSQVGDLSSVDPASSEFISRNAVECKSYQNLHLEHLVYGGRSGILKFWQQANNDAKMAEKRPVLIAKQNYKPIIICSHHSFFEETGFNTKVQSLLRVPYLEMSIFLFDYFLENAVRSIYDQGKNTTNKRSSSD